MQPSSTGVLLGLPLEVIQPSSVLPSKSRTQPSAFSFSVSSLSAAPTGAVAISSRAAEIIGILISVHHLFLLGPRTTGASVRDTRQKTSLQVTSDQAIKAHRDCVPGQVCARGL